MVIVISALRAESAALLSLIKQQRRVTVAHTPMILGHINGQKIGIISCGVALAIGLKSLAALLQRWAPQLVLNVGCAGSLTEDISQYSLFVPAAYFLLPPSLERPTYRTPPSLYATLMACCKMVGRSYSGRLVTVPEAVMSPYERWRVGQVSGAAVVDMEGAQLATVAQQQRLPLGCIKWISDTPQLYSHTIPSQTMRQGSALVAAALQQFFYSRQSIYLPK